MDDWRAGGVGCSLSVVLVEWLSMVSTLLVPGVVFLIPIVRTCVHRILPRTGASYGGDGDAARDMLLEQSVSIWTEEIGSREQWSCGGQRKERKYRLHATTFWQHLNGSQLTRKVSISFVIGLAVTILAGRKL